MNDDEDLTCCGRTPPMLDSSAMREWIESKAEEQGYEDLRWVEDEAADGAHLYGRRTRKWRQLSSQEK